MLFQSLGEYAQLIELFVSDYRSRLYIWLITLSFLENLYLQLFQAHDTDFVSNLIVLNGYLLLPACIFLAIPYTFYILRYTRNSTSSGNIYNENIMAIRASSGAV